MTGLSATALIKAMKSPLLLVGADDRVLCQNDAITSLLQYNFTGRNFITALRQPATIDAITRARADHVTRTARYLLRVDGSDHVYEVTAIPVEDSVIVTFNDQTAAEETVTLRRDFVANVSHELRTPLTALLGFIETLQGPAKDDPAARERFLGIMATEADRLRRLVDDLLSLSRVEEMERSRPVDPVDLGVIVRQATELLTPLAEASDTALLKEVPEDLEPIPGDDAQLQQVLNNLVENAIKYGATERGIVITVMPPHYEPSLRKNAVHLSVQDYGQGIPAHHLIRLTERFYRVDAHRSRAQGGTGLGLAIVKHIANRHRGKLVFDSIEGQGTKATLILPSDFP